MRHLTGAIGRSLHIHHQIEQSERPDRHRQHEPEKNGLLREIPDKYSEHRHDRAAGAHQVIVGGGPAAVGKELHARQPGKPCEHDGGEVEAKEFAPPHDLLDLTAEKPEHQHVADQMPRIERSVDKAVAHELPDLQEVPGQVSLQREKFADLEFARGHEVEHPEGDIDDHDRHHRRPVGQEGLIRVAGIAAIRESHGSRLRRGSGRGPHGSTVQIRVHRSSPTDGASSMAFSRCFEV